MRPTQSAGLDPNFARPHGAPLTARRGAPQRRRAQRATRSTVLSAQATTASSAVRILSPGESAKTAVPAATATRASEAIARRALVAIRVAMGLVFVTCGLSGFVDFAPAQGAHMQQGAMAFGGALLVAGSLLPLLKGTEVIVETILELQRTLSARRAQ